MKIKYVYIGFKFFEESDKLEHFFEQQTREGWMLEKIGMFFFKLKKIPPKEIKFFIDCQRPTDDYIETLKQYGYHYIDNYKEITIFYSEQLDIDPIQSDPVVKAISYKELYKPSAIIMFYLLGLFFFGIVDVFHLSTIFFRSIDHIILNFNAFTIYLLFKLIALSMILEASTQLVLRIKYNREIKGLSTPKWFINILCCLYNVLTVFMVLLFLFILICHSINDFSIIFSVILFFIVFMICHHYINKELIKIESKLKRILFSTLLFMFILGSYHLISDYFSKEVVSTPHSLAYESDTYNFSDSTYTLFYNVNSYYGNSDEKDEFDEYVQTYRETIYQCRNQTIAQSIFRALVRDADCQRRTPDDDEIERITEEKGSFDSIRDVPFYSYQTSLKNLKHYYYKNVDICCGYDCYYLMIKDNIVYDLQIKDHVDIQKLIDFYQ